MSKRVKSRIKSGTTVSRSEIRPDDAITFTTLARGYSRCNQTGEKTKNTDSYRRAILNKRPNRIPEFARNLPRVKLNRDGSWDCPNSRNHSRWDSYYNNDNGKPGTVDYCRCGTRVFISFK